MIVSLLCFGGYFFAKDVSELDPPGWIPLVALMVYVVSFSVGYGPIPWLMMGEIFPGRIRGAAASVSTAFNWSCTFVVTKTFMDLQAALGAHGVFWLFAAVLLASTAFTFFFVPETRGKTLEDIERLYTGEVIVKKYFNMGILKIMSVYFLGNPSYSLPDPQRIPRLQPRQPQAHALSHIVKAQSFI